MISLKRQVTHLRLATLVKTIWDLDHYSPILNCTICVYRQHGIYLNATNSKVQCIAVLPTTTMIHLTYVQSIEWLLAIMLKQWPFDRVLLHRVFTDALLWLAGYELVRLSLLPNSYVSINQIQWNAVLYTTDMIQPTSVLFIRWLLAMSEQWLFDWAALCWRCAVSVLSI